jgi:hypothetical protein
MSEKDRVLEELKRRPKSGITALDFPRGYRLSENLRSQEYGRRHRNHGIRQR